MTHRLSHGWLAWEDVVSFCASLTAALAALMVPVTGPTGLGLLLDPREAAAIGIGVRQADHSV